MTTHVILTSKPGQFRTEVGPGLRPVEAYDYVLCGRVRAQFVIAVLEEATRVRVVDETEPATVNMVPSKFLERFGDLAGARAELQALCSFGTMETQLRPRALVPAAKAAGTVQITFVPSAGKVVSAPQNSNLLRVSLREKGGIPFKCGGGLCGTCKCRIEEGLAHTDAVKPKERKHLTDAQLAAGYRMACQTFVLGDIAVSW